MSEEAPRNETRECTVEPASRGTRSASRPLRRALFFLSLLIAAIALAARFWPVDRSRLIPVLLAEDRAGAINMDGRVVVETDGGSLGPFNDFGLAFVYGRHLQSSLYPLQGIIDRKGNVILPTEWERIESFDEDGLARIFQNGECGWVDTSGEVVIAPEWDGSDRKFDSQGMARVYREGKVGWIDRTGEVVIPLLWDWAEEFDDHGMAAVMEEGMWGWIDRSGKTVLKLQWQYPDIEFLGLDNVTGTNLTTRHSMNAFPLGPTPRTFDEHGLVRICREDRWGWMNRSGEVVIAREYDHAKPFDAEGMAKVSVLGQIGWVDLQGNMVIQPKWQDVHSFDEKGMACVKFNEKWGWINREGETLIEPEWDEIKSWEEYGTGDYGWTNYSPLSVHISLRFQNRLDEGSVLFDPEGWAMVRKGGKWGWINRDGEVMISPQWDNVRAFDEGGLACVEKSGKQGWIDRRGEVFVPLEYDPTGEPNYQIGMRLPSTVKFGSHGMVPVGKAGRWGWINRSGETVIPLENFLYSEFDENGLAFVGGQSSEGGGLDFNAIASGEWLDRNGKTVIPRQPEGWAWLNYLDELVEFQFFDGRKEPRFGYVAASDDWQPGPIRRYTKLILHWLKGGSEPFKETEVACVVYDPEGNLIFDSRNMRFETKCWFWFVCGLVGAVFTRPKRRADIR